MFTIIYLFECDEQWKMIAITMPSEEKAFDVATCLRASGRCANVRVWHKGVSEAF